MISMPEKDMAGLSASSDTHSSNGRTATPVGNTGLERRNYPYRNICGSEIDIYNIQPGADATYDAKVQLLNEAILDVGMGKYQWLLTLVTGLGWFLDSFWMFSFTIIEPAVRDEAQFFTSNAAYLFVSQYVGLVVGSLILPTMTDFIGRRTVFNLTLVSMGMAGLVGAGMPTFSGLCVVSVFMGIAAGGNQSVDSAIFLEMIPASHQYLLTMQGMFSGLGKLCAAAFALGGEASCHYVKNMGWRYTWWTLGTITLFLCLLRFCFHLHETPKYLLGKGRVSDVVKTVRSIAAYNGKETWLTLGHFQQIEKDLGAAGHSLAPEIPETAGLASLHQSLKGIRSEWVRGLFSTQKSTLSTCLFIIIWSLVGLSVALYDTFIARYLESKGVDYETSATMTYKIYIFQGLCAIPGPIIAGFAIETRQLGRQRTGALTSILAGVFLFLYSTARSQGGIIAFSCVASFFQNMVVSLMFAYTPETFAAPIRGTGMGIVGFFYRIFGLVAAIIVALTTSQTGAPMWICAALWIVAGFLWLALPYDTRARASS